jgi:hypothetical protein
MDVFDTLAWTEILVKTTFFCTPTLTVPHTLFFLLDVMIAQKKKLHVLFTSQINIEWIQASP